MAFGAVHIGGTVKHLDEYSVGIMEQIVKNRNLILSNNMTHQWTDISGEYGIANSCFEEILEERNLTLREFMEDEEAKRAVKTTAAPRAGYFKKKRSERGLFRAGRRPEGTAEREGK